MKKRVHEFEFFINKNFGIIYDIVIGFLSVFSILIVTLQFDIQLSKNQSIFLNLCDNFVYSLFLIDGIIKCILSDDWKEFIMKNKIDYIALIPIQFLLKNISSDFLNILRFIIYFLRLVDNMKDFLRTTKVLQIIASVMTITLIGSVLMYFFEREGGDVKNYWDSLWLAIVTLTTIGYGDITPKTSAGRLVATILMLTGIGFLSTLTSTFSTYLITLNNHREHMFIEDEDRIYIEITELSEENKNKLISYYNYLKQEDE
ncbi:potassium channel family protein [Clostridium sp.]|mgnify:CR=1 FL=1|uniref:potassium channel family protein n=1 Tax=Clostridium sp. TaxID=1506 RepID=UPI002A91E9E9|nr:ion channel [Clostridium sp.]MDY6013206.1 ion channel [Clostridium sp.]